MNDATFLQPPAARRVRLCEALQARDEHPQELRWVVGEFTADHHRLPGLGLSAQQPGDVIEQRAPSAARLPEHQHRLAAGDATKDLAYL